MSRALATERLYVRIPPSEKQELREEARARAVSMSALARIDMNAGRERRRREALMSEVYRNESSNAS
jgi:post-segregation antitoxin (ccd killing protein)